MGEGDSLDINIDNITVKYQKKLVEIKEMAINKVLDSFLTHKNKEFCKLLIDAIYDDYDFQRDILIRNSYRFKSGFFTQNMILRFTKDIIEDFQIYTDNILKEDNNIL